VAQPDFCCRLLFPSLRLLRVPPARLRDPTIPSPGHRGLVLQGLRKAIFSVGPWTGPELGVTTALSGATMPMSAPNLP